MSLSTRDILKAAELAWCRQCNHAVMRAVVAGDSPGGIIIVFKCHGMTLGIEVPTPTTINDLPAAFWDPFGTNKPRAVVFRHGKVSDEARRERRRWFA